MAEPYRHPPLGPYDYYEVISAFRKTIKLNKPEEAIFWLENILRHDEKAGKKTAAKQLWIMAAEDINDQAVTMRAFAVYQMINVVGETDQLYFLTYQMCKAEKWWETEEGREVCRLWAKAEGDVNRNVGAMERGGMPTRPIPEYAKDRHTRTGWENFRRRGWWDDRFSGTFLGRFKTQYLFKRDGKIDENSQLDEGFIQEWGERLELMGQGIESENVKYGMGEINGEVYGPRWVQQNWGAQQELFPDPGPHVEG